jgi:hypothetical protein
MQERGDDMGAPRRTGFALVAATIAVAACGTPEPWPPDCGHVATTQALLDRMDATRWLGWDGLGTRTMQVHVDDTVGSASIAACAAAVNPAYALGLSVEVRADPLAMGNSRYSAFWHRGVPAAMISEDVTTPDALNPFAHTTGDTADTLALPFAFDVARAAVATALSLAEPAGP